MASPTAARTALRARAASRGDRNMIVSASKRSVSHSRARLRQPTAKGHTLEALEDLRERRALGEGPPQHLDHLLDRLGCRVGVSGRPALADEKADVPDDAVADLAESREMDEEPLLEQRRQRAVQVGRLRKLPEFLDQPRRRISGTEEIGEDAETIGDLAPETKRARLLRRCVGGLGKRGSA